MLSCGSFHPMPLVVCLSRPQGLQLLSISQLNLGSVSTARRPEMGTWRRDNNTASNVSVSSSALQNQHLPRETQPSCFLHRRLNGVHGLLSLDLKVKAIETGLLLIHLGAIHRHISSLSTMQNIVSRPHQTTN